MLKWQAIVMKTILGLIVLVACSTENDTIVNSNDNTKHSPIKLMKAGGKGLMSFNTKMTLQDHGDDWQPPIKIDEISMSFIGNVYFADSSSSIDGSIEIQNTDFSVISSDTTELYKAEDDIRNSIPEKISYSNGIFKAAINGKENQFEIDENVANIFSDLQNERQKILQEKPKEIDLSTMSKEELVVYFENMGYSVEELQDGKLQLRKSFDATYSNDKMQIECVFNVGLKSMEDATLFRNEKKEYELIFSEDGLNTYSAQTKLYPSNNSGREIQFDNQITR